MRSEHKLGCASMDGSKSECNCPASDDPQFSQADLNARIAAAQQEALKLASAHYPVALFICGCGWQAKGNTEQTPREQWASHVFSLLPAAQKATEERDNLLVAGAMEVAAEKARKFARYLRDECHAGDLAAALEQTAADIEKLTPASALAALADFARKERLNELEILWDAIQKPETEYSVLTKIISERIASLLPAELQKEGK